MTQTKEINILSKPNRQQEIFTASKIETNTRHKQLPRSNIRYIKRLPIFATARIIFPAWDCAHLSRLGRGSRIAATRTLACPKIHPEGGPSSENRGPRRGSCALRWSGGRSMQSVCEATCAPGRMIGRRASHHPCLRRRRSVCATPAAHEVRVRQTARLEATSELIRLFALSFTQVLAEIRISCCWHARGISRGRVHSGILVLHPVETSQGWFRSCLRHPRATNQSGCYQDNCWFLLPCVCDLNSKCHIKLQSQDNFIALTIS
jgi:hypothetical protein